MIKPFEGDFPITQLWGENPEYYARFGIRGHNGVDYGLPKDTPVRSPHDGKIIEAAFDAQGYGLYYKIENDREGSVLAHLTENYLAVGAKVTEGQLIGKSGNTGNSTGPHLHWGYYYFPRNRNDGYLGYINQIPMLALYDYYKKVIEQITTGQGSNTSNQDLIKKLGESEKLNKTLQDRINGFQTEMNTKLALKDSECKAKLDKIIGYTQSLKV